MMKLINSLFVVLIASLVLLAIPFTDTFIFDSKKLALFIVGLAVVGATVGQLWKTRSIVFTLSPFCAGLALLGASALLSSFLSNAYPYEALYDWGGILLMVALVAGFGHEFLTKREAAHVPFVLGVVTSALAILTALQIFGVGPSLLYKQIFDIDLPNNGLFNLAESALVALQIMVVAVIGLAAAVWQGSRHSSAHQSTHQSTQQPSPLSGVTQSLYLGLIAIVTAGAALTLWSGFFNAETKLSLVLPWTTNLQVVKGILRSPKSALIGMGPSSFAHAYNLHKPTSVNTTPYWNIEFNNGVNVPITLMITLGLVGLVAWGVLIAFFIKHVLAHSAARQLPLTWIIAALLVLQVVLPPSITMLSLFGVLFAYWLASQSDVFEKVKLHTLITRLNPDQAKSASVSLTHLLSMLVMLVLSLFIIASVYGASRAFASAHFMFKSTKAIAKNEPAHVIYELQKTAVSLNPMIDLNRRRYGLINLAVARALANKPNLTQEEQEQVMTLIQQSIREGRAATVLQPDDARNWETLGSTYQNLIGVATGADQWTINSYARAIETDPANPLLWFQLGTTFYQNQQYAEAARAFAQAAQLKPDYVNAYYNLANATKLAGNLVDARLAYQRLLTKVEMGSAEHQLISAELAQVEAAIAEQQKNAAAANQPGPAADQQPSVVESGLARPNDVVPSQSTDLVNDTQQYLQATPSPTSATPAATPAQ